MKETCGILINVSIFFNLASKLLVLWLKTKKEKRKKLTVKIKENNVFIKS